MPKQVDTADVRALMDQGAQVVEVLPETAYAREHLPGAVNIPFTELGPNAVTELDAQKPTIVYCYDRECDLSARAAYRFETLGFTDVYDYVASKVAWMACGLPIEGTIPARSRAGAIARDAPRCSYHDRIADIASTLADNPRVVVTHDDGVVLGVVRAEARLLPGDTEVADVLDGAPPSVRPSITATELAESMDRDGRPFVLVTRPDGVLLGVIERADLYGQS